MRKSLFFGLFLIPFFSFAQIFNFEQDWFSSYSFFKQEFIKLNKVKSIDISIREKLDGKYFQAKKPIIRYEYNPMGLLENSFKYIRLRNKIDTALLHFSFDASERIIIRNEKQGPFDFGYHYTYTNEYLDREIKIDNQSKDTSYIRYYKTTIKGKEKNITYLNAIKKPFSFLTEKRSSKGLLLSRKKSYLRNKKILETYFIYDKGRLIEKTHKPFSENEYTTTNYNFSNGKLDLILIKKDNKLIKKMAFTYDGKGLPKEIIERDMIKMSITIYELNYSLY